MLFLSFTYKSVTSFSGEIIIPIHCLCHVFSFISGVKYVTLWHRPIIPSPVRPVRHLVHEKGLPMSLVEDIVHLLHMVLDYFGVNPDMVSARAPIKNPIKLTYKITKLMDWVCENDKVGFSLCVFALQLVPVWDSQLCGQYRSIVRMIGTNLPLAPTPRVHFQVGVLLVFCNRLNC